MQSNFFIVDNEALFSENQLNTLSFETYLNEYPKRKESKVRLINLCDTSRYLSQGYYCSLLAESRNHQVIPSVQVINSLRGEGVDLLVSKKLLSTKANFSEQNTRILICMGEVATGDYKAIAAWIYRQYPTPILDVRIESYASKLKLSVKRVSFSELNEEQRKYCLDILHSYAKKSWRKSTGKKKYRWQLAILVDPKEKVPPSNKGAISRFVKAAEKQGIQAKTITTDDFNTLGQYDALFIRQTTAIDHPTYVFSCEAEKQGLVVFDDPNSILRCCNKVFLHDAFSYHQISSLNTLILSDTSPDSLEKINAQLGFPVILKMPEGSFSKGVYKVHNLDELKKTADSLLVESALYIAQQYLYTDFDWRIGVLNGRALYACRYYMAKNHWQIYNHSSNRFFSGGFDALPTFEVPRDVLKQALKAAKVVGDGLYGVDLKEVNNKAYVIEVNDNPSIDFGVEDRYLGEEIYMQIMAEFHKRLESRGR